MLHNRYRQPGGEDAVAEAEVQMLRSHGVDVIEETSINDVTEQDGALATLRLAWSSSWSRKSYQHVSQLCAEYRPDIVHVHNFWMRLSPAIHAASWRAGAATVQTLHNFRLLCTNAMFLRNGVVCEDCLGKSPWRGIVHRCYRDSYAASAAVVNMIAQNRRRNTWDRYVAAFIALTPHSYSRFVAGGIPANRLFIKPNFVADPGRSALPSSSRKIMYFGRLAHEKGLETLLRSWAQEKMSERGQLIIAGDGPAKDQLHNLARSLDLRPPGLTFIGLQTRTEISHLLGQVRCIVLPSIWYEGLPVSITEAFARSRSAVVSRIGALADLVDNGRTGLTFTPGDVAELGRALKMVLADDQLADRMGEAARSEFLQKYTAPRNFEQLMRIYHFALDFRLAHPTSSMPANGDRDIAAAAQI
jgi:glycosyltransferase involved in cell wall biosynthesis